MGGMRMHHVDTASLSPGALKDPSVVPPGISGECAIEAVSLVMRYRRKTALDGLSMRVPRGCVCGFLGPNGAGKTTTLRVLMGVLAPTAGQARVLGLDPRRAGLERRRRVGYLFPIKHLYAAIDRNGGVW